MNQIAPTIWRLTRWSNHCAKRYTSKISVQVDDSLLEKLERNEVKPRKHPGVAAKKPKELPVQISRSLKHVIGDHPVKNLMSESRKLNQYLKSRHPPPERHEVRLRMRDILKEIEQREPFPTNFNDLCKEEQTTLRYRRDQAVKKLMGQRNYTWKPIKYETFEALVYAVARSAQEYAVLTHILHEISTRDADFKPQSYFDFGAGVGTGMWAASALWRDYIREYYNVDCSRDMNELSELILREGHENQQLTLRNVYYRQFLPALDTQYDLVMCAYTLFELGGSEQRKETLLSLWRKSAQYMLLVEEGTRRGSEVLVEARDYLLAQGESDESLKGHVFAPCPHDAACPRFLNPADNTPCNFELAYKPLDIGDSKVDHLSTRYSYMVLKKGPVTDETRDWPRLVRPTLLRSKHVICRTCTADARLQEVIFTQSKHGRMAFRCAKASSWGDRLPMAVGKPFSELAQEESEHTLEEDENITKKEESPKKNSLN